MHAQLKPTSGFIAILFLHGALSFAAGPPNFVAEVSQKCLSLNIDRRIDEEQSINDVVLGATVRGKARFRGTLETRLVPCADHAIVELVVRGMIDSTTVSRKGRVAVSGIGKTSVGAIKRLEIWDPDKVHVAPTRARCKTKSAIQDVSAGFRSQPLRDRARETVYQDRELAEAEASRHAERRVASQIDGLIDTEQLLVRQALLATAALKGRPQTLVRTLNDRLQYFEYRTDEGTKFSSEPPRELLGQCDAMVLGHESWFNSLGTGLLAGKWVSDEQIADGLKAVFGSVPSEYRLGTHMPRWSVQFAPTAPISLSFESGTISVLLHVSQTRIGERLIDLPYEVSVRYGLACSEFGPELRRDGGVVLRFGGDATASGDLEFRQFLERKATAAFDKLLYFDGLALPGGGQLEKLKQLKPAAAMAQGGWLALGWNFSDFDAVAREADLVQTELPVDSSMGRSAR